MKRLQRLSRTIHATIENLDARRLLTSVTGQIFDHDGSPQGIDYTFSGAAVTTTQVKNALTLLDLARSAVIARADLTVTSTGTNQVKVTWPTLAASGTPTGMLQDGWYESILEDGTGSPFSPTSVFNFGFYRGDANGDTDVDFDDLLLVAQNYNGTNGPYTYAQGDFTNDGVVNFDDLLIVAQKYGTRLTPLPVGSNSLTVGSASASSLTLNFSPPTDPDTGVASVLFTGFRVFRSENGVDFAKVSDDSDPDLLRDGGSLYSWQDTGLEDGTKYWYRVRPYNTDGENGAETGNWHTTNKEWAVTVLPAPDSLGLSSPNSTTVTVTWQDQSEHETIYEIQRATNPAFTGATTFTRAGGSGQLSYTDTTVNSGVTYYYHVRAVNGVQLSSYSAAASVTPVASGIAAPSNVLASSLDSTHASVQVSWSDNSNNETQFQLEWSEQQDFSNLAGSLVVPVGNGATTGTRTQAITSGLDPGTVYYVRVAASNGGSPTYAAASASTLSSVNFSAAITMTDEDPGGIFDPYRPVTLHFERTTPDISNDLIIQYRFRPRSGTNDAIPNIDFDPGYAISGSTYEFIIPANETSADMQFVPMSTAFWQERKAITAELYRVFDGPAPIQTGTAIWGGTTHILITKQDGTKVQLQDRTEAGLKAALTEAATSGNKITELIITGHGAVQAMDLDQDGFIKGTQDGRVLTSGGENITQLFRDATTGTATIRLNGCNTAADSSGQTNGNNSVADLMSVALPGRTVIGHKTTAWRTGKNSVWGNARRFRDGNLVGD